MPVADLRGAREAVAPSPAISGHSYIQKDGCIVIKTLILANSVIFVHFNAFQRVAPTTPPGSTLVSSFSQTLKVELNTLDHLTLGGISVLHKTKYSI